MCKAHGPVPAPTGWAETVEMFERHLGPRRSHELPGITVFACDNGDTV